MLNILKYMIKIFWNLIFLLFYRTLNHFFLPTTIHFMLDLSTETLTSLHTKRWEFRKARFLSSTPRYLNYTKSKSLMLCSMCDCLLSHILLACWVKWPSIVQLMWSPIPPCIPLSMTCSLQQLWLSRSVVILYSASFFFFF